MMRRILVLLSVLLATLGFAPAAFAHAMLDHTEPRVGNTVPIPPHELKLWFTQNLEPAFSKVSVTNASGQRVDAGKPIIDGAEITVPLRSIGPGLYRVRWHVVSTDTHTTEGNFTFSVGK